ncbi:MAG: M20 metallopeptidase family protein, partial [Sporomusa sp.]
MNIFQQANAQLDYLTKIRQQIHQNPEMGFKEFDTTALIREELGKWNIEMPPLTTETGVLGIIRGEKTGRGKVVALRADIDALPIEESTGLSYASCRPGVMHACGHDGHTAVLLGVAKLLSGMRDQFAGMVKLIFQPAEEQLGGASSMIEAGVLTNPKPDVILGLHCGMETPLGKVSFFPGPFMASADKFILKIKGVGAHSAYPHRGRDP